MWFSVWLLWVLQNKGQGELDSLDPTASPNKDEELVISDNLQPNTVNYSIGSKAPPVITSVDGTLLLLQWEILVYISV